MEIKILGTRGEIDSSLPYHSKHSGILINETLLLDIGEKEFLKQNPKYILITHLHPDHAFFVREKKKPKINIPVYAPEKKDYKNINLVPNKFKLNSYEITPLRTHHSKKVKSRAYLIKKRNKKILYTADMIWINKKHHHLFKNLDIVITEASFLKKGGMVRRDKETGQIYGHTGVPNLINLFKKYTDKILLVHFGEWFYKNTQKARKKIKKMSQKNKVKIYTGYDGKKISI